MLKNIIIDRHCHTPSLSFLLSSCFCRRTSFIQLVRTPRVCSHSSVFIFWFCSGLWGPRVSSHSRAWTSISCLSSTKTCLVHLMMRSASAIWCKPLRQQARLLCRSLSRLFTPPRHQGRRGPSFTSLPARRLQLVRCDFNSSDATAAPPCLQPKCPFVWVQHFLYIFRVTRRSLADDSRRILGLVRLTFSMHHFIYASASTLCSCPRRWITMGQCLTSVHRRPHDKTSCQQVAN